MIRISKATVWISLALLVWVTATNGTYAQRGRGRGGDDSQRGGDEGGRSGGRGGRRGGWGGPGGGPGVMPGGGPGGMRGGPGGWGGMRGGGPGGGPAGFLARMDANGNGMLDPEESQGPARMFLDRIASEAKLDLSRPIPLDRVTKAFEEMRNRRRDMRGGPGEDGGRGGPEGGSSSSSDSDVQPLVPGFGEPDLFDPVPGFGELGERFAVKIDDEDRKEALRTMGRSDRNRDGVLDADEIRRKLGRRPHGNRPKSRWQVDTQ